MMRHAFVTALACGALLAGIPAETATGRGTLHRDAGSELAVHGPGSAGGAAEPAREASRGALSGLFVTDVPPAAILAGESSPATPLWTGPFDPAAIDDLHVVAILDRRLVGDGPVDQVTRFVLPDGHLYELRVTPVDPAGAHGSSVAREELGPLPVPVQPVRPMRRTARALPADLSGRVDPRHASFTTIVLPVSGTFITKHALYGTWTVEVALVRGRETVATTSTTFEIVAR